MSETDFETPLASDEYFKAGFMADSHTGNESAWTLTRDVAVAMQWAEAEPEFPVTRVRLLPTGAAGKRWVCVHCGLSCPASAATCPRCMQPPEAPPTPAREPVAWKIIDERFTSGGILTQDRAEMEQLAKNPSALIMPLVPLMDPPAAPTAERSEGAGVADIVKLYAMRDNAELDAVLADAVRRGLKSVEVPNGILGTIRYELPPTPEAGTVTDGIRRDPRNGKVAEGTWPIACEQRAFVNGAKWWEWHKSKATMFPSDQRLAADEAVRLYGEPTPEAGTVTEAMALAAAREHAAQMGESFDAMWDQMDERERAEFVIDWSVILRKALAGRRGA